MNKMTMNDTLHTTTTEKAKALGTTPPDVKIAEAILSLKHWRIKVRGSM